MTTTSRLIRPVALAAVLALAAAGCGGNSGPSTTDASGNPPPAVTGGSPADQLSQAASATSGAGTYKTTFELAMEGATGPITLAGTGEFQADPPLGKVTVDFSAITGGSAAGNAVVIFDSATLYMQIPGLGGGTTKSWFKIDADSLDNLALGNQAVSQLAQGDPTQALQYLRGATGDIEEAGTETIRDVETTKYTMTIDLNKAAEQADNEELKQAILSSIETTGVSEIPAEVWIDGDGRVRRMVTHYADIETQVTDMTVTVEIYDFGADVDIEVPSDDEVLDFGDMGGLLPTTTMQQ